MPLTRTVSGPKPKIDVEGHARAVAKKAADVIRARVIRGLDIFDRPFAGYDKEYAKTNGARVDLGGLDPGGLLATLVVVVERRGTDWVIVVKPAPQHMKVGALLQSGTPNMKARPWLGFSPRDLVTLRPSS